MKMRFVRGVASTRDAPVWDIAPINAAVPNLPCSARMEFMVTAADPCNVAYVLLSGFDDGVHTVLLNTTQPRTEVPALLRMLADHLEQQQTPC